VIGAVKAQGRSAAMRKPMDGAMTAHRASGYRPVGVDAGNRSSAWTG